MGDGEGGAAEAELSRSGLGSVLAEGGPRGCARGGCLRGVVSERKSRADRERKKMRVWLFCRFTRVLVITFALTSLVVSAALADKPSRDTVPLNQCLDHNVAGGRKANTAKTVGTEEEPDAEADAETDAVAETEAEADAVEGEGAGSDADASVRVGLPPWTSNTPPVVLRRAIAHMGDLLRFDELLHKVVVQRKPITVVGIGSSCTSEFGGRKGPQLQLLNLEAWEFARLVNPDGWLSTALDWLVKAYPPRTNKSWRNASQQGQFKFGKDGDPDEEQPYWLINLAVGAIGPLPWSKCLGSTYFRMLPRDVDLVVIEWALAANYPEIAKDLEIVLQKLLKLWDPPPAFLFVNFFFWCRGNLWCRDYKIDQKTGEEVLVSGPQLPLHWKNIGVFSFSSFDHRHTGDVTEDDFRVLAQYYGLPMLSMRDAFWFLAAEQEKDYHLHDIIAQEDMGLHPGISLARKRYSEILINFFRTAIAGFSERQRNRAKETPAAAAARKALLRVPPPFFQRLYPNDFGRSRVQLAACFSYETMEATAPTVRFSRGFNFTRDPDSKIPKPGYCTWEPGSVVEFVLDTEATGKGLEFDSPDDAQHGPALVEIRYLTSYQRMGRAKVECVEGCSCSDTILNAHISQTWSVPAEKVVEVTQAPKCVIRLTSLKGKGGTKFKILSLSVSFVSGNPESTTA